MDAVNGTLLKMRDLAVDGEAPFKAADLNGCNDISGTIGITGTPVIDPATDTIYFWAKSYLAGQTGVAGAVYRFHAIDALSLAEKSGFPKTAEGMPGQ